MLLLNVIINKQLYFDLIYSILIITTTTFIINDIIKYITYLLYYQLIIKLNL